MEPLERWDKLQWKAMMGGSWKQRAGEIRAVGFGNGFATDVVLKSIREASSSFRDRSGSQTGERQWGGWSSFLLG